MNQTDIAAQPTSVLRPSGWSAGRIAGLVIGAVLVLLALALLGAGGTALWADRTQRDAGYVTTDVHSFSTGGAALATVPTHLGSTGMGWLYSPGVLGKVRIRVTPAASGSAVFVGIARSADVDRYLAGVRHTVVSEFFRDKTRVVDGGPARSAPGQQHFWVASDTGRGTRTVLWDPSKGSWTVVVMNTDGHPGVDVAADLGARMPAVFWIAVGVLAAGAVFISRRRAARRGCDPRPPRRRGLDDPSGKGGVMQNVKEAATAFLANTRVAVTGVSRTPKTHGSNTVYKRLRERGYEVFAVNPNTDEVEGDRSYKDLASIPGGVDAVVIGTRPEIAEGTMRECAELGIKHVWMHWGGGASSVSPAATKYGRQHGITVIDGGCPLMFGPTADLGHKVMRVVLGGRVPKQV